MENLFQSSFLNKLQDAGQKICANNFVSALQAGMMGTMSIIMTGSVFQIACALMSMVGVDTTGVLYTIVYMPYNFTMGLIGLWITMMIAFNYARSVGVKSPLTTAIEAAACFIMTACFDLTQGSSIASLNITYLGSQGLFIGFLIAWVTVRVDILCQEKKIYIKMPDVCPPSLVNSMAAIVPSFFNVCIFLALSAAVVSATGGLYNLASGFMAILTVPLQALTSLPGMFVLAFIAGVMWCFGIHGTMLMVSVLMGPMIMVAAENAAIWEASIQAGATFAEATKALKFYPVALFGSIALCGGTGNTLPLVLMGLKAKSEQIRAVSKLSVLPGWFGINEPVTFGMPVMYNPILAIPYILAMLVSMLCTLIGYKTGFIAPGHVYVGALMPMGFAQFLSTFRWQNALWDYLMMIPCGLVWYPFFKMYDKQLSEQEAAGKEEVEA